MDPDRVHAYLQAACAGLGFDIGEVWWTSDENGSSSLAAIEENPTSQVLTTNSDRRKGKKFRFVQLYTSKSFENRRAELVNPPEGDQERDGTGENLKEHVLSPRLVDAISRTTQVIWATTKKQEGLTGRSDIRLQTAVGMPVAVDEDGNMCIVVMFSPNNIQSSDEAMEYLQSISQSATSSNIPCLMPVFKSDTTHPALPPIDDTHRSHHHVVPMPSSVLGEGVTAGLVSLDDPQDVKSGDTSGKLNSHELAAAPKDNFGIPVLPVLDSLGQGNVTPEEGADVFDEASYGIWSTIMDSLGDPLSNLDGLPVAPEEEISIQADPSLVVALPPSQALSEERRERLTEFCEAFLEMSVFDYADVWAPAAEYGYPDCLRYVMSSLSNVNAGGLNEFKCLSVHSIIKFWTGAVGRAFSSGSPVWSTNSKVFVDPARAEVFARARIQTVVAVPVFAKGNSAPVCVLACYSLVQNNSIPFVLRFVQQALRLLWQGVDAIELPDTVDHKIWKDVAPADLGEMAADMEMQEHFMSKKRPHSRIGEETLNGYESSHLTSALHQIRLPNGDVIEVPLQLPGEGHEKSIPLRTEMVRAHMTQALRHVRDFQPYDGGLVSDSPVPKRHYISTKSLTASGSIGQPLQRPRGFPSAIVPSSTPSCGSMVSTSFVPTDAGTTFNYATNPSISKPASQVLQQDFLFQPRPLQPPDQFSNNVRSSQMDSLGSMPMPSKVDTSHLASLTSQGVLGECRLPMQSTRQNIPFTRGPVSVEGEEEDNDNICRIDGCNVATVSRRPYCEQHSGNRLCEHAGCGKCAQGSTRFCIAHGGGRRCTFPGCDKGARDKFFCAAHGGGKRCSHGDCTKSAVGGSNLCTAHGGGRRCAVDGCEKSAQSSTKFCVKHGGGKKCAHEGCEKVARGRTPFCAAHGGGVRCKLDGCSRVAIGRMQLCRAHGGTSSRSRKIATAQTERTEDLVVPPQMLLAMSQYETYDDIRNSMTGV